jgi:tetratricopeptide (TPR) repeat protein
MIQRTVMIHYLIKIFVSLSLIGGCNFSSGLKQQIIEAQNLVDNYKYQPAVGIYEKILKQNISPQVRLKINYQLAQIYSLYLLTPKQSRQYYKYVATHSTDLLWKVSALEKLAEIEFLVSKNYESSIDYYNQLLAIRPVLKGEDLYSYRIAISLIGLKKFTEAKARLATLVNSPNFEYIIDVYNQYGLISFYEQNWSEAINNWKEYLKRETKEEKIIEAKYLIANCYESNGQLREAYNIYYSLLQTYPQPEVIKNRLKSLYARRATRKR